MAHIELQLLSRIIRTGCIKEILEWGLQDEDFRTSEGRGLFTHILGYWSAADSRGAVPGPEAMQHLYKGFELCDDDSMTTDALCSEVRKTRIALVGQESLIAASELMSVDPMAAVSGCMTEMALLQSLGMKTNDSSMSGAVDGRMDHYRRAENGLITGVMRWPWQPFNDVTMGVQEDDYIVLYGRPKSKKSFVLGEFIANCYDQDLLGLVYTKEMPDWQLYDRVIAAIGRFPYDELRLGKLPPEQRQGYMDVCGMIKARKTATAGRHDVICISGKDAPAGQDSMMWLRGKIEKYRPDVVFIDGLYLMASSRKIGKDNERVMSISRDCRQMVLDLKTPVVATMQANRKAAAHANAELDEIAYSDAIGQDTTCAIRVINEKNDPATIALVVAGSREWTLHGVRIGGIPYDDLGFKAVMSEKDIEKAKTKDSPDDEGASKGGAAASKIVRRPINNGLSATSAEATTRRIQQGLDHHVGPRT